NVRRVALILLVLLCACKTRDERLASEVQSAASWTATFELTCESWLGNRVPSSFVRATLKSGRKTLDQVSQSFDEMNAPADLRSALSRARTAANQLENAIDRGDRAG